MKNNTKADEESEPSNLSALTQTVILLYQERRFNQPVEMISAKHVGRGYSTLPSDVAWRLRDVINEISEFYEISVHPVTEFYFTHGYRLASLPLKGKLAEDQDSYIAGLKCLAVKRKKVAGLRFVTKPNDRLHYIWHNEIMKIPGGLLISRCNKIAKASANKTLAPNLARELLGKPLRAMRIGINDVKAIPSSVKELKNQLDQLL